jgi:hypothetical protein
MGVNILKSNQNNIFSDRNKMCDHKRIEENRITATVLNYDPQGILENV